MWMILAAVFALSLGASPGTGVVQAKESALSSRGSIIYQQDGKEAALYAEDLFLLEDRLSTIPEDIFDPACYTHTHQWEYRDINEKTHTRHCAACGSAYDLMAAHTARQGEDDPIVLDDKTYPGRRYTCICGYQWVREASHELIFEAVDETNHRIRCALDATGYCRGYEPVEEEHYAYTYVPCQDGMHHKIICIDCGYTVGEEDCSFTAKPDPDEGDDRDPALLYCECGNGQAEASGEEPAEAPAKDGDNVDPPAETDTGEPEDAPVLPDPPTENPAEDGADSDAPTNMDTGETGDAPVLPSPPTENPAEDKDNSDTPAQPDTEDAGDPSPPPDETAENVPILPDPSAGDL